MSDLCQHVTVWCHLPTKTDTANLLRTGLCGRIIADDPKCQSTVFSILGLNYSQVCGQLQGYQLGTPDAYYPYYRNPSFVTIDGIYVDGVSITYSSAPRKHIWTYMLMV